MRSEVMQMWERSGARLLVPSDEWLRALDEECLKDYIKSGGASVKFVSGSENSLQKIRDSIRDSARHESYYFALLDPAKSDAAGKRRDLHRIERFFFAATEQVNWKAWAAAQARSYLEENGVYVGPDRKLTDLEAIAQDNGREPQDLLHQYQREFATSQLRDMSLTAEFRTAVTALGRAQLVPDSVTPTMEEVLQKWFRGQTLPGAANVLKKVQIYERISPANARHILASFCRWLPRTGHNGLIVVLDFRPYEHKKIARSVRQAEQLQRIREAVARGAAVEEIAALTVEDDREPAVTYSDAAYAQMLALLRRFIDEIDSFERFLLVVLTSPAFYEESSKGKRSYNDYDALQTRIGLEVRDTRRANPAAALVHLGDAG